MSPKLLLRVVVCTACLCLTVCQGQVRYRVVAFPSSLGNLPFVNSNSLNNNTHAIVGTTATPRQAFVWINGKVRILSTLGGTTGYGDNINNHDVVVGSTSLATDSNLHATMWIGKQVINLDEFGGVSSFANVINNLDQVAGAYDPGDSTEHAYFLTSTGWTGIGDLGGSYTFTFSMNDAGMVTGQSDISNTPDPVFGIPPFHGYVWQNGTLTDFGPVFGDDFNTANYVNAAGQIIGSSDLDNDHYAHAFLYDHGTITDLLTLPGDQISWGLGINNMGQMVGTSGLRNPDQQDGPPVYTEMCPCHAVLWQNGKVIDLGKHVPSQYSLELALAITDDGVILAKTELPELAYVLLVPTTQDSPRSGESVETAKSPSAGPRLLKRSRDGSITGVN